MICKNCGCNPHGSPCDVCGYRGKKRNHGATIQENEEFLTFMQLFPNINMGRNYPYTKGRTDLRKRSSHLTRLIIEGISSYSEYKGAKLLYSREYDPTPNVNVDLVARMDINRAIKILHERGELSDQEVQMLKYVQMDGRLSRRDISFMIQQEEGVFVNQRTVSRRLETAYFKISKFLGNEYSDNRVFKMVAKKKGYPPPYILSDDEIDKVQQIWEKI